MNAIDPAGPQAQPSKAKTSWSEAVKTIGGLVAVVAGVVAVLTIAIVAMLKDTSTAATIASATAGVIATIVGAYFGVKVGTDQSKTANEGQKAEAAKAQVYAAHLPPDQAPDILKLAEDAAQKVLGK
jgi:hypothetical protein